VILPPLVFPDYILLERPLKKIRNLRPLQDLLNKPHVDTTLMGLGTLTLHSLP